MVYYWDQASVLKQLGVLPSSLYCKANSSEMTLPVVGVTIADPLKSLYREKVKDDSDIGTSNEAEKPIERVAGMPSKEVNYSICSFLSYSIFFTR